MSLTRLVPEPYVSDIARSLEFYTGIFGFSIVYQWTEERFAYLARSGAKLMLEQPTRSDRTFLAAPLTHPRGIGINLQIAVTGVEALCKRCQDAGLNVLLPLEERWYRRGDTELGNRQFVVADQDGYLLRFAEDLGQRELITP